MHAEATTRTRLKSIAHLLAGVVIILKGVSKLEGDHPLFGYILVAMGIVFLVFALFHKKFGWLENHHPLLLAIEGIALALVAFSYYSDGKFAIPIIYAGCAVVYFILSWRFYKHPEPHK